MAKAKKRVTIKDVAAEVGVSYQTVSRVINGKSNVSPDTRLRIQRAIERLNFRPSLAARTLPSRRTHVIGLIIPYESDYLIRDPHLLAQISGIDAEASARGYNLLLATSGQKSGLTAYDRFLQNQVADGALVIETAHAQIGNQRLAEQDYPYVTLGYDLSRPQAYVVHSDDYNGAKVATQYLIEQGHHRIGMINGPNTGAVMTTQARLAGHQAALAAAGLSFDPSLMTWGDYRRHGGQQAAEQLLRLTDRPTAIFALNDRMAIGAIHAIQTAGLSVPHDVAVIGFDDIPTAGDFKPSLTTVRQPAKEMGQQAATMLFRLIEGEPLDTHEVVLPSKLVKRQSA